MLRLAFFFLHVRALLVKIASLQSSLPVEAGSGIFARADDERLDLLKVLIVGPRGTPYACGCFEFDVWLPSTYPHAPPQVRLVTTGHAAVRFNPNLYNCGKVLKKRRKKKRRAAEAALRPE